MADRKISELTNITGANLADGDEFVVVDASADETKALTFAELKAGLDTGSGFVRITGDTMTGELTIRQTGTSDTLVLESTNTTGGAGPDLVLARDSATPADNDGIGRIRFRGKNDADEMNTLFYFQTDNLDVTNGNEAGRTEFWQRKAGTLLRRMSFLNGETVFNEDSSATLDFRVETNGHSGFLFVDCDANKAMIGRNKSNSAGMLVLSQTGNSAEHGLSIFGSTDAMTTARLYTVDNNFIIARGGSAQAMTIDNNNNVIFNNLGADQDFRVEGDTAPDLFKVDAGTDRIGINEGTPLDLLHIGFDTANSALQSSLGTTEGAAGGIRIDNDDDTSGAFSGLMLRVHTGDAKIVNVTNGVSNKSLVKFFVDADTSPVWEAMRIDGQKSVPEVVVNELGHDRDFRVETDGNSNAIFVDASTNQVNFDGARTNFGGITTDSADGEVNLGLVKFRNSNTTSGQFTSIDVEGTAAGQNLVTYYYDGAYRNRLSVAGNTGVTVFNESSQDINFRVESNDVANMLYLDAGSNFVALGNNTQISAATLSVHSTDSGTYAENSADTNGGLSLYNAGSDDADGGVVGITFRVSRNNNANNALGVIDFHKPSNGSHAGRLHFKTRNSNGTYYEGLRVDSEQGVFVNAANHGHVDFHVDTSSHNNFLMVDAGANKAYIGRGTATDSTTLTVRSNYSQTYSTAATEGQISITNDTNANGNAQHSGLHFRVSANGGSNNAMASIGLNQPTYNSHNGQLYFNLRSQTQNKIRQYMLIDSENGIINNNGSENYIDFRVKTDAYSYGLFVDASADRVGVGTGTPQSLFHVEQTNISASKSTYSSMMLEDTDAHFDISSNEDGTWGSAVLLRSHNSSTGAHNNTWAIARNTNSGANSLNLNYGTSNDHNVSSTKAQFRTDGSLKLADGIRFNNDTAEDNTLNDYEEGNWSPTFSNAFLEGAFANATGFGTRTGRYVKIGAMVHCWCEIASITGQSGNLTGDDNFSFTTASLPYTPTSDGSHFNQVGGYLTVYQAVGSGTNASGPIISLNGNAAIVAQVTAISNALASTSARYQLNLTFKTNS